MSRGRVVVLEGLPGAGKTTLGTSLLESGLIDIFIPEVIPEEVLLPYLKDMKSNATKFQNDLQEITRKNLEIALAEARLGKIVVLDRGFLGNRCFAETQFDLGFISLEDIQTYREKHTMSQFDLEGVFFKTIYMKVTPERSLDRIKIRSRNGESCYDVEYLSRLKLKHDDLLKGVVVLNFEEQLKLSNSGTFLKEDLNQVLL